MTTDFTTVRPFDRYAGCGAEDSSMARRMPKATLQAHTSPRSVDELVIRLEKYTANPAQWHAEYPWATRFVMGYPLPWWQRQRKWSLEQNVRFITSIWEDVDVGSYLVNDQFEFDEKTRTYREHSEVLLDGQQRLSALQDYLYGEFAVPDAKGIPCFWHELTRVERRFFESKIFSRASIRSWDEDELQRVYNLRAFGGTPHEEHERAPRG